MFKLKYIYDCPLGITRFDKYFEYLDSVKNSMPLSLAKFACDKERYVLRSNFTLHDAWLTKFSLEKTYSEQGLESSLVRLDLLHSSHTSFIEIAYSETVKILISMGLQENFSRPVDLLLHEFTVLEEGVFRHMIQFDKGEWISVDFKGFEFATRPFHKESGMGSTLN